MFLRLQGFVMCRYSYTLSGISDLRTSTFEYECFLRSVLTVLISSSASLQGPIVIDLKGSLFSAMKEMAPVGWTASCIS